MAKISPKIAEILAGKTDHNTGKPTRFRVVRHGHVHEVIPLWPSTPASANRSGERGEIREFSAASWGRMICKFSRLEGSDVFMTLTLPGNWRKAAGTPKKLTRKWLNFRARFVAKFEIPGGVWVREFQQRGAPHFHAWMQCRATPTDTQIAEMDRFVKTSWVASGGGKISDVARCIHPDAAARYSAKEGAKRYQKTPPRDWPPGRFWGTFGRPKLTSSESVGEFEIDELPEGIQFNQKTGYPFRTNWPEN